MEPKIQPDDQLNNGQFPTNIIKPDKPQPTFENIPKPTQPEPITTQQFNPVPAPALVNPSVNQPTVPAPTTLGQSSVSNNQQSQTTRPGPEPVVGNFGTSSTPNGPKPSNPKKKKLFIAGGAVVAVVLAVSGYVLGFYVPNKPENVYSTGIERSGNAINELILKSTEPDKFQQIQKSEFGGLLDLTSDYANVSGTFNAKLDPTKSDSKLHLKLKEKDSPEKSFGLNLLTELKDGKRFPNTYFQLSGLNNLGLDAFVPGISDYDDKWIAVEADYLESLGKDYLPPEEKKNKENVSAEEIAEFIRGVSEVNSEYLFSTKPDKAVLENREYLGKEKTAEGVDSFHYKVGINKAHSIDYCKAMVNKVMSARAVKKVTDASDQDIEKTKNEALKDCDESTKDLKDSDTFDMWVDAKYKVIHKFRIYNEDNKTDKYTDIGQIYNGGDKLSFFAIYHEDQDNLDVKFTLDVDLKALNSNAEIKAKQDGEGKFNLNGNISAKPFQGEINTEKPAGAISIEEILKKFGYDPTDQSGISQSQAKQEEQIKRCAEAYEYQANNNGRGEIPTICQ